VTTVLLDTHALYWWSSAPRRLSRPAARAVERADELAIAAITWYELAWLARHSRINVPLPLPSWLEQLSSQVRTVGISPAIAVTAASFGDSFSGDPVDRLIYATAVERGWPLITKDERMHAQKQTRRIAIW
jgi:PIN domain nuclease of toxin-antitoxin system